MSQTKELTERVVMLALIETDSVTAAARVLDVTRSSLCSVFDTTIEEWEGLSYEECYQRIYYAEHKKARTRSLKEKWHNDPVWREKEQERAKKRRGLLRAQTAKKRFEKKRVDKREQASITRPPRFVEVKRKDVAVFTTGDLGREVGRAGRSIRSWLRADVLPGATAFINGNAFFSRRFCNAVFRACERLYYLDGRGELLVLKRLIREELSRTKVSYVLLGDDNTDRTVIDNA